jgi:hypothetical protein
VAEVAGLAPKIAGRLEDRWRLRRGEVYDAPHPMEFVKQEMFLAAQGAGRRSAKVGLQTAPNREQKVTDIIAKVK